MPLFNFKQLLRWTGSALSFLAIIFIVHKLKEYGSEIDYFLFTSLFIPIIFLSLIYSASNLLLAFAWKDLLRHFGVSIDHHLALRLYGISQIAKYIPGNIFHFVGRQAIGQEAGLAAWPLGKSAIWEISVLIATGCLFSILVAPHFFPDMESIYSLVLFVFAVLASIWSLNRWYSSWISKAFGLYTVFLIISALIFLVLLMLLVPANLIQGPQIIVVCGAYVIAWLIGLVTPGAPAGAGIREIVLYSILNTVVNETELLTAIIFGRIITVGGDLIFYLVALVIKSQAQNSS